LAINCMMQAKIHPGSFAGMDRGVIHYFTRLHTDSALVPVECGRHAPLQLDYHFNSVTSHPPIGGMGRGGNGLATARLLGFTIPTSILLRRSDQVNDSRCPIWHFRD